MEIYRDFVDNSIKKKSLDLKAGETGDPRLHGMATPAHLTRVQTKYTLWAFNAPMSHL